MADRGAAWNRPALPWRWTMAFWWFLAGIVAANRLSWWRSLAAEEAAQFLPWGRVAYAFIIYTLWALVTPAVFRISRAVAEEPRWSRRIGRVALAAAVFSLFFGVVRSLVHNIEHRAGTRHDLDWIVGDFPGHLHLDLTIFVAVLAVGLAGRYHQQRESQRAAAAELQAELVRARLEALQMQLNPHFLFNTLNTISALVEDDPQGTRRVIARLSELLRRAVGAREEHEVELREEVELIRAYLEIMRARFGDRLETTVDVEEGLEEALVPLFLLQPLVENALEHGVGRRRGAARVAIRAWREGESLCISIYDDGPGPASGSAADSGGIGLENCRAKLAQLYPDQHSLHLLPHARGGTVAELQIPLLRRGASKAA